VGWYVHPEVPLQGQLRLCSLESPEHEAFLAMNSFVGLAIFAGQGSGATSATGPIWPAVTKSFSEVMTGLGVLAAAIYFGIRLYRGYFVQNLSLGLELRRCTADKSECLDYLDITMKLTKGDRSTTRFEDMEVRVWWPGVARCRIEKVETIRRYSFGNSKIRASAQNSREDFITIFWDEQHPDKPFLNMTPGEATTFSHLMVVPADLPCRVDVVLVGRVADSERYGQWRASATSFPFDKE
jgi:hypothetical protein